MSTVSVEQYLGREYDVECEGKTLKLKPMKAWVLAPKGRKGIVIGLFKCPEGRTIRKAIGKVE